jgi:hypothetical protein
MRDDVGPRPSDGVAERGARGLRLEWPVVLLVLGALCLGVGLGWGLARIAALAPAGAKPSVAGGRAEDPPKDPPSLKEDRERLVGLWYKVSAPKKAVEDGADNEQEPKKVVDEKDQMVIRFRWDGMMAIIWFRNGGISIGSMSRYKLAENKGKRFIRNEDETAAIRYELDGDRLLLDGLAHGQKSDFGVSIETKGEWKRAK